MLYFFTMVALLTLLTQTGGVILLVSYGIWKLLKWDTAWQRLGSFVVLYLVVNLLVMPYWARLYQRRPLPWAHEVLRPQNYLTLLANRHYVHEDLYDVLMEGGEAYHTRYPNRRLVYFESAFPLGTMAPMPPHRSHGNGRAVDLAFAYTDDNTGEALDRSPNWLGYGRYEGPMPGEPNWPQDCRQKEGSWWYSLSGLLALRHFEQVSMAQAATEAQLRIFIDHPRVHRIFLEPHLKQRWHLMSRDKVRFHGCKATRHDDHFHVAIP